MSTSLYPTDILSGLGAGKYLLSPIRGLNGSVSAVTNTTAGGTKIPVTMTAGGTPLSFWFKAGTDVTIALGISGNMRGKESATSVNAGAGWIIELYDSDGATFLSTIQDVAFGTEYSTTDAAKALSSTVPTSTLVQKGKWIKLTPTVRNVGTMAAGTVTNTYSGPSGAAGDFSITFGETLLPEKFGDWTEDFTSTSDSFTTPPAAYSTATGQVVFSVPNLYDAWECLRPRDLTGSSIVVQYVQAPNIGLGSTSAGFELETSPADNSPRMETSWVGGSLIAHYYSDGTTETVLATITYDSTVHKWLKIAESGGTVTWYYSTDGISWTSWASVATASLGFSITNLWFAFNGGYWNTETDPGQAIWDNLNLPPNNNYTGVATFSGSGSLTTAGNIPGITKSVALSGSGSLTVGTKTPGFAIAVSLSGSGSLAATGVLGYPGTATLAGSGTLSTADKPAFAIAVAFSGSGSLATAQNPSFAIAVSFSGNGTLSTVDVPVIPGTATFAGTGILSTADTPAFAVSVSLSGGGSLTTVDLPAYDVTAAFSGSGTLSEITVPSFAIAVAFSGEGTLTSEAGQDFTGIATFAGSGDLETADVPAFAVSVVFSGDGVLTTAGIPALVVTVALSGSGLLTATAPGNFAVSVSLSGSGALATVGLPRFADIVALTGSGSLAASTSPAFIVIVSLAGSGILETFTTPTITEIVGLSGDGQLDAFAEIATFGIAAFTGEGSLVARGADHSPIIVEIVYGVELSWRANTPVLAWRSEEPELAWRASTPTLRGSK